MKIEKEAFAFWMIVFTIMSIPAILITYFTVKSDFTEMLLAFGLLCAFLIAMAFCLSIPEIYHEVETLNKKLNDSIVMFGEKDIVVYCNGCQKKISDNEELIEHRLKCNGYLHT